MATPDQTNPYKETISAILSFDADSLLARPSLGDLNFAVNRADFQTLIGLLKIYKNADLKRIPFLEIKRLDSSLNSIAKTLVKARDFKIEGTNPAQVRDQISNELENNVANSIPLHLVWLPLLENHNRNDDERIDKIVSHANEKLSSVESVAVKAAAALKSVNQTVDAVRNAAADTGVQSHKSDFELSARQYATNAKIWLVVTIFAAVVTIVIALVFSDQAANLKPSNISEALPFLTGKSLVIILLITSTIWCGRQYSANKHNQTVNEHRSKALGTFRTFVEATDDPAMRDAVLHEATRSGSVQNLSHIFSGDGSTG